MIVIVVVYCLFTACMLYVADKSRSCSQSPPCLKSQLAMTNDTPTSQSDTKISPAAGAKSSDHDTASVCVRSAENYQISKRKTIKSVFAVCKIVFVFVFDLLEFIC